MSSGLLKANLNDGLDRDHLAKVVTHEVGGRCSGKSVAHAATFLGILETEREIKEYFIIAESPTLLDHFRLLFVRVMNEMEIEYQHKNYGEFIILGRRVRFATYCRILDVVRGTRCLIYDVDDSMDEYCYPSLLDLHTIDEHVHLMEARRRRIRQEQESPLARIGKSHPRQHVRY